MTRIVELFPRWRAIALYSLGIEILAYGLAHSLSLELTAYDYHRQHNKNDETRE